MKKNTNFEHGFTLLELLIVCLLISISLAITIPSLRLPGLTDELGADGRKLISIVREVKEKAVADRQPYLLHFDTMAKRIWFEKVNGKKSENDNSPGLVLADSVNLEDVLTLPAKKSDSSEITLWINEQGYSKQAVIQLSDDNGEYLSLEIAPFVSEIKLHETLFVLN